MNMLLAIAQRELAGNNTRSDAQRSVANDQVNVALEPSNRKLPPLHHVLQLTAACPSLSQARAQAPFSPHLSESGVASQCHVAGASVGGADAAGAADGVGAVAAAQVQRLSSSMVEEGSLLESLTCTFQALTQHMLILQETQERMETQLHQMRQQLFQLTSSRSAL